MNLGQGQAHESHLGPPSEIINVSAFLASANEALSDASARHPYRMLNSIDPITPIDGEAPQDELTAEQMAVAEECSVNDLRNSLNQVVMDPRLMTHVTKTHQAVVHSIYDTAESSGRRKRRRTTLPEPSGEHADVTALRSKMDNITLSSWPLTMYSASFIRPPKHSDRNTLIHAKKFGMSSETHNAHEALLFVSIYNNLSWGHRQLFRSSQHVLVSSQTLGDLFEVMPCCSSEIPKENVDETGDRIGYEVSADSAGSMLEASSGCVICIDGTAYGDGQSLDDYSEKLLKLLDAAPKDGSKRRGIENGASMHDTTFGSLSIQLHKPYWLLHAGNCEHYVVIDQIRLHHPTDPPLSEYPLTTQITPPLLDLCRVCNKVPAVHAILGDIRLGESPFVICAPCWRWMGEPSGPGAEDVMVVPLPKYEHGWGG